MSNRGIKFRAWTGERMIDSPYFFEKNFNSGSRLPYCCYEDWRELEDGRGFPCEIMQFTGLKEHCNEDTSLNREIYEGDVVEFIDGERLSVEWNDDTCLFQYSDGSPINNRERYSAHKEIIGNIYENSNT